MRKFLSAIFILVGFLTSSAQNINEYKYILVPETFEFTDEVNEYQLNALLKYLLEQEGFNTMMRSERVPNDLNLDPCLGLNAGVKNNSGMFVTKLVIEFKDCKGKTVFQSKEGRSREKKYKAAYKEALRDAFSSVKELDYEYTGKSLKELPGNGEAKPAEVIIAGIPKTEENPEKKTGTTIEKTSEMPDHSDKKLVYNYSGRSYFLEKTAEGYQLFENDATEPIALLIETNEGESFIYNSLTRQGIAYFDSNYNLVIEYVDRSSNKKVSIKYNKKD